MRIATKEFKVYKYQELGAKAKEKVKLEYIEHTDPNNFTYNVMQDLKNIGLQNLRPYYSLSYCQGDGLCLVGHIDFDKITPELKELFCKNFLLPAYKIFQRLKEYSRVDFNHIGSYYHKNSVDIDIYVDGSLNANKYNNHRKLADKLITNIKEWYMNKCDDYEKWGYEFFYGISDEELQDFCDGMEYEFLEDGTIFN